MKNSIITRIWIFYKEGFSQMTWGRSLWLIILLKLFIMFFILKLFFFPAFLGDKSDDDKQEYVKSELIDRANSTTNSNK